MADKHIFSVDWTNMYTKHWYKVLQKYKDMHNINFLEVGCFEGRSTVWLLDNILTHATSKITCIDTFEGSIEHHNDYTYRDIIPQLYDTFCHNISTYRDRVIVKRSYSQDALKELKDNKNYYDFVYIDADHHASSVLEDAVLSFPLLKQNGILIFDDYNWGEPVINGEINLNVPQPAINAFLQIYANKIEIIDIVYNQVIIRKL